MTSKLTTLSSVLLFTTLVACSNTPTSVSAYTPTENEIILVEYFSDAVFVYDESKDPFLVKETLSDLNTEEKRYLYNRLIKEVKMPKHHKNIFLRFIKELN